ncbi:MAG TPA: zinc-dependent metalloprotease, partial [Blastocatellia bacterium]|nr:zinc-dependent metalloprotease [Blastocatellia bacterium]
DAGFAIGPSRANPYTGQVYDADISFTENMTRFTRSEFTDLVAPLAESLNSVEEQMKLVADPRHRCNYALGATHEAAFGYGLLAARGLMDDPAAQDQYIKDFLTSIAVHEVGHTLGLRHNFRASTLHEVNKLQDAKLTLDEGLTGSVMDYMPVNIGANGAKQGQYWQTSLGPYDYWAIEYAYKPMAASSPEGELAELRRIASRVADPKLAYGTDEDSYGTSAIGLDPRTNQWDFGTDPLQYYADRIKLVHELWATIETKAARQGENYQPLRRVFNRAFGELAISLLNANKYIGAVYHNRDHVGDPNGRLPYEPVSGAKQRQALELIKNNAFRKQSVRLPAPIAQ